MSYRVVRCLFIRRPHCSVHTDKCLSEAQCACAHRRDTLPVPGTLRRPLSESIARSQSRRAAAVAALVQAMRGTHTVIVSGLAPVHVTYRANFLRERNKRNKRMTAHGTVPVVGCFFLNQKNRRRKTSFVTIGLIEEHV